MREPATYPRFTGVKFTSADDYRKVTESGPSRLVNCDFRGLDLATVNLTYCIFDGCNLSHSRLHACSHAEFHSCDLRHAKLAGADFRWVKASNCRIDGADLVGIQTTLDCHFWSGLVSELSQDAYLLLYWMSPTSPLIRDLAAQYIPERVKVFLDQVFSRDLG